MDRYVHAYLASLTGQPKAAALDDLVVTFRDQAPETERTRDMLEGLAQFGQER